MWRQQRRHRITMALVVSFSLGGLAGLMALWLLVASIAWGP
jgi:hypothetical protein